MTLALLLTAVTGAWAAEPELLVTIQSDDDRTFVSGSKTFDEKATVTFSAAVSNSSVDGWYSSNDIISLTVAGANGYTITSCKFYTAGGDARTGYTIQGESPVVYLYNINVYTGANGSGTQIGEYGVTKIEVYGTAEPPIVVEPGEAANTWTFNQPGGDVVLTPIYAKTASFATTGTGSEVTLLAPAAAEGVIAGTDDPLIAEGTGIVATTTIGETPTAQGTVMYAVTSTKVTDASELIPSDWKNTVPTAKIIADNGGAFKVWYYIQGADTPDGQQATEENTFNNSDVASLTVTVRSNKFDLALNPANANTIEGENGKGTVTVKTGDAEAVDKTEDITDGKLTGIKMGSEVKLNTKAGYKFRKVEVKKAASTPTLKDALADGATVVITYTWMNTNVTTFNYTKNGDDYSGSTTGDYAGYFTNGMSKDGTRLMFVASNIDVPEANVSIDFFTDTNEYSAVKSDLFTSFTISVNGTDITSQLTKVK